MESIESTQKHRQLYHRRRGVKICCGITFIIPVILLGIFMTLAFTVFKPKQPEISARPLGTPDIKISSLPKYSVNATVHLEVTIRNLNYGSFEYGNSTAYVNYHDDIVAEYPLEPTNVPAHGQIRMRSLVSVVGNRLVSSPFFMDDVKRGCLNFTSNAVLHGEVNFLRVLKFKATAVSTCDISVVIASKNVTSTCKASIKL